MHMRRSFWGSRGGVGGGIFSALLVPGLSLSPRLEEEERGLNIADEMVRCGVVQTPCMEYD
jgi:hypothetical protein